MPLQRARVASILIACSFDYLLCVFNVLSCCYSLESQGSQFSNQAPTKSRGNELVVKMKAAEEVVQELNKNPDAWPFRKPVTKRDVSHLSHRFYIYIYIMITWDLSKK